MTRDLDGSVCVPEERIDRITALRGWTNGGAQYLIRWDRLGSLELGKLADFVVTDKDYFMILEEKIINIKTLMKVIGGSLQRFRLLIVSTNLDHLVRDLMKSHCVGRLIMKKEGVLSTASTWLAMVMIFLLVPAIIQAQTPSMDTLEKLAVYPTLIVHNGKIATMDQDLATHQAMAVRGNKIWKLGTDQEIKELAGPQTELINAREGTVLPGMIDAHSHPHLWGLWQWGGQYDASLIPLYIPGKTIAEVAEKLGPAIRRRIQQNGPEKWIMVSIPHEMDELLVESPEGLTRADLDRIAPNTPVALLAGFFTGYANSKAKQIMLDKLGYEQTGLRIWYDTVYGIILGADPRKISNMLLHELKETASFGVTTIASHSEENVGIYNALNLLDRERRMPVRWAWAHQSGFLGEDPAEYYKLLGNFLGQGSDYLWNFGVGYEGWASTGCPPTAPAKTPELQDRDRKRIQGACQGILPQSKYYLGHLAAVETGLRLANVHAMTDRALDAIFRIMETAIRNKSTTLEQIRDLKMGFDHANIIRPDQIPIFAHYGFWMNFQATQLASTAPGVIEDYGEQYLKWVMPVKSFLDAGARIFLSSDAHIGLAPDADTEEGFIGESLWSNNWPRSYRNSVWPWVGTWVTREINGRVYSPEERIDRITALRAWTNWPAEFLLRGDRLGSLEPGKLADFIVIDRDYFSIPEKEIVNINTLLTAVDGRVVYRSPIF